MIRICLAAVAALALSACSKAPEDVTARYTLGGGTGSVTVQAAANGDARVDSGQQALVHKGDTDYMLITDPKGAFAAKMGDFLSVIGEMMREDGMKPSPAPQQGEYELAKTGTDTLAGIQGDIWKVTPKEAGKAPAADPIEAVISSDPAYAHVGKALAMQTRLGAGMQQLQGGVGNLDKRVEEMLGKGMVLRFENSLKLDKVEKGPIDPKVFALPTVLDKAALKARLSAARAAAKAAQAPGGPAAEGSAATPAPAPAPAPKAE